MNTISNHASHCSNDGQPQRDTFMDALQKEVASNPFVGIETSELTVDQIAQAWIDAQSTELKEMPLEKWAQAADLVESYLKVPHGRNAKAPAAVFKAMGLPTGSTWMEAMAFIADDGIDWTESPGSETYLQRVSAAQAADNAKPGEA